MADGQTTIIPSEPVSDRPKGVPANAQELGGKYFMADPKGALQPLETIRVSELLEDETVRRLVAAAVEVNAMLARFKADGIGDVNDLLALIDQEYQVKKGGSKGNVTLNSYDGTMKVSLAIADQITFGPELQAAKRLVDECLTEWSADSRPELQAIVQRAFNTDKEGLVNRTELFGLLRLDIQEERWQRAMKAIRDSFRVVGTKEYIRFYQRAHARAEWSNVRLDLAAA